MKKYIFVLLFAIIASKSLRILNKSGNIFTALTADDEAKNKASTFAYISKIKDAIKVLRHEYSKLIEDFNEKQNKILRNMISGEQISKLNVESNIYIMTNLTSEKYLDYIRRRVNGLGLSKEYLNGIIDGFESLPTIGGGDDFWFKGNALYPDEYLKNAYNSILILGSIGSKPDCYDVVILHFRLRDFIIADDKLMNIRVNKNSMDFFNDFGFYYCKEFSDSILTKEEYEALVNFEKILSFRFLADIFSITVEIPIFG